tara:strand:- start:281 stop:616 length:336 start_codon:yes stop_codon:yes gene_type:complete
MQTSSIILNLKNIKYILNGKNNIISMMFKECIFNDNTCYFMNIDGIDSIMRNRFLSELLFYNNVFGKRTRIRIGDKVFSLAKYGKLTKNKNLLKLLLKYKICRRKSHVSKQ